MIDTNKLVAAYVRVRDMKRELEAKHDAELKPLNDDLAQLSGALREFMEKSGSDGIKTEAGTCYLTTRYSASLADPSMFMRFVVDNDRFDLLDKKANATAVKDYVAETGHLPPGCNLNAMMTVGVKRGKETI